MRKLSSHLTEICIIICVFGISLFSGDLLLSRVDNVFLAVTGKDLLSRSQTVRTAILLLCALAVSALLILLDRLLFVRIKNTWIRRSVLYLILTVPFVQILIICANQILRRDDYWEIADAHSYGFPGSMFFEVTNHNGRYLSWTVKSLYAVLDPVPFINILLFLNILLLAGGLLLLSRRLLRKQSAPWSGAHIAPFSILTAVSAALMTVLLSTNVWEVWFWGSGAWVYGLSLTLCVLSFGSILCLSEASSGQSRIRKILVGILVFWACGGSELSTASLLFFLLALLVWKRFTTGKWNRTVLFYTIEVCVCCAGILLLSGSVHSAGEFSEAQDSSFTNMGPDMGIRLFSIIRTVISTLWGYCFVDRKTLLMFLAVFFMIGLLIRFDRDVRNKLLLIAVFLIIAAPLVLTLNVILDYTPSRVVTIPVTWMHIGFGLLLMLSGSFLFSGSPRRNDLTVPVLCAVMLAFCVNGFYRENISAVRAIRNSWEVRDESLRDAFDSEEVIHTCALPTMGSSHADLEADESELYNIAFRMYYRVPGAVADGLCPPFEDEQWVVR